MPLFSVIIPAHDAAAHLPRCLRSVLTQGIETSAVEVIVIDDGSSDATRAIAEAWARRHPNLRALHRARADGPGVAREAGIVAASGTWIVFLDSDDSLAPDALSTLRDFVTAPGNGSCDAVRYGWRYDRPAPAEHDVLPGRYEKAELLRKYLSLFLDGSVIYVAMRRQLLLDHDIHFFPGLHEDVDYLFKTYWAAREIGVLDAALYHKQNRAGSIINTVSTAHLLGFLRAWGEIATFLLQRDPEHWQAWLADYTDGVVGTIATRVREVFRHTRSLEEAGSLYGILHAGWTSLTRSTGPIDLDRRQTRYFKIVRSFLAAMEDPALSPTQRAASINSFMDDLGRRSWSCRDLHHSVYLAPDQVRTCCKRFFVDGQMKGDVVLLDLSTEAVTPGSILQAKRRLHTAINRGEPTPCSHCPFMEFKDWGPLEALSIRYLSLEYHSICNLRCSYCSETYYGGLKPQYDVRGLVRDLIDHSILDADGTVVWGGGEPVLDRDFEAMLGDLEPLLPRLQLRILTNAVKHSAPVENLLAQDRATITVSLDAGTKEVFRLVRGRDRLAETVRTLRRYARARAQNITLKYIFTAGNGTSADVEAFAALIGDSGLSGCNMQISTDFKAEQVDRCALIMMVVLYGLLLRAPCKVVFFDDLLRQRLSRLDPGTHAALRQSLEDLRLGDTLLDQAGAPPIAIWGAGWQARHLLESAHFFKTAAPCFLVDSTPEKIGTRFMGYEVRDPEVLLASDVSVVIAAAQNYPIIYQKFSQLGIDDGRLVRRLIV